MFEFQIVVMIIRGKVFLTVRNGFKTSSIIKMIDKIILSEKAVFISPKVILTDKNDYSQIFSQNLFQEINFFLKFNRVFNNLNTQNHV
jgi:hypothetical protein